jgi:hypothetical protein
MGAESLALFPGAAVGLFLAIMFMNNILPMIEDMKDGWQFELLFCIIMVTTLAIAATVTCAVAAIIVTIIQGF